MQRSASCLLSWGPEEGDISLVDTRASHVGFGVALTGCVAMLSVVGCERPKSADRPATTQRVMPIEVLEGKGLLLSFFDSRGQLLTVTRIAEVEETSRAAVMVTDPSNPPRGELVQIADLRSKYGDRYRAWIEPRGEWMAKVMPKVSELNQRAIARIARKRTERDRVDQNRRRRRRLRSKRQVARRARPAAAAPTAVAAKPRTPRVVVFGTSWCPSCRHARAYLQQRGVPFTDLDVEKNSQAAQKMLQIQASRGLKRGAVPVIIIGNKVFQGFSKMQIEAALTQASS